MSLTEKQFGVLKRIIVGLSIALCIVGLGSYMNPFGYNETFEPINKLHIAILCCLVPTFFLAVSIGRLAKHRFLTPEDIDGGGLSAGTPQAKLLQSLLQNTIEQALLASLVYCAWAAVMPTTWLSTVPIAAIAFGVGRILFFFRLQSRSISTGYWLYIIFLPFVNHALHNDWSAVMAANQLTSQSSIATSWLDGLTRHCLRRYTAQALTY